MNSLNVGDIIEFDNVVLYGPTSASQTERIVPTQVVSGNPKNLSGGIILDSEAERGAELICKMVERMDMPHVVDQLRKLEEYGLENEKKFPWMPAAWNRNH